MAETMKDTRFACCECEEWYEDANMAMDCCPSEADEIEVYICLGCDTEYFSVTDAEACCEEEADDDE